MKRLAALFALAMTASPVAAQPHDYDRDWKTDEHRRSDDALIHRDVRRDRFDSGWQQLSAENNAREGRSMIRLPSPTMMSRIRIEGTHGVPVVTQVDIIYRNRVQRATVNRRLERGEGVDVAIDQRRPVRAIVVHTDTRFRGGYSIAGG